MIRICPNCKADDQGVFQEIEGGMIWCTACDSEFEDDETYINEDGPSKGGPMTNDQVREAICRTMEAAENVLCDTCIERLKKMIIQIDTYNREERGE